MIGVMQICMNFQSSARENLIDAIREKRKQAGLSYAEIGRLSGVHSSQVSRICRGEFRTLSSNVMQICKALNVDDSGKVEVAADQQRLEAGVIAVWDRTPQDARRILRFLRQLGELRRTG
ncbi:MAG: XRE family transcriptional regulator [Alphaproteobacteria bacterium]|nr:MAG: XRE family transcriptional regulator [Alphaproteobacteria bacterium]